MEKVQNDFLYKLPKAELHMHLEGALEPDLLLKCTERNKIKIPYTTVEEVQQARQFKDLPTFVKQYQQGQQVLCKEQDFYDLTLAYAHKVYEQGVKHAEIFIETQSYADRVPVEVIMQGLLQAQQEIEQTWGISIYYILCFLRDRGEESAFQALQNIKPWLQHIKGVGLASVEYGYPAADFTAVFTVARGWGLHAVAHAGEDYSYESVVQAIRDLQVERIDHGISALEDSQVVAMIKTKGIGMTVCPISNVLLKVVPSLAQHPIRRMLQAGLEVSIHSDDPAYFSSYIADNYQALYDAQLLSREELIVCAQNSFKSSFLPSEIKHERLQDLAEFVNRHDNL